jgi:hypothetical protein
MRILTRRLMIVAALALTIALVNCRPTGAPPTKVPSPVPSPMATPMVPMEISPVPTPMPAAGSGIRITATIGPTCPGPERPGQVCTKPYVGEFVVTSKDNSKEVARFTTDNDGRATIDLPPGDYVIMPKLDPKMPYPKGGPMSVSVPIGAYTDVTFDLDTGIR